MIGRQAGYGLARSIAIGQPGKTFATSAPARLTANGERLILGIETSCDDSCAALVAAQQGYSASAIASSSQSRPLARLIHSEVMRQDHGATQGIQPLVAHHNHMINLPGVIERCLGAGGVSRDGREIDAVAFTCGPGMAGSLSAGHTAAKTLAAVWGKPLIPVHHMEAHALTPFLTEVTEGSDMDEALAFPFLTLLLSGGHTMLVLARGVGQHEILANSYDDSIGDAFDKSARALHIPSEWMTRSPGASLEAFAAEAQADFHASDADAEASLPVIHSRIPFPGHPQFSYSGVKAALRDQLARAASGRGLATTEDLPLRERQRWAAAFQTAAFDQIIEKVRLAAATTSPASGKKRPISRHLEHVAGLDAVRHLVVSGGVASNTVLRRRLAEEVWRREEGRFLLFPPIEFCVDNAAMIAHVGALRYDEFVSPQGIADSSKRDAAFRALPRAKWSLEELQPSIAI